MRVDFETDRTMIDKARNRRPWLQVLSAVMALSGSKAELLRHSECPWASVTFSGTRHTIALRFVGADAVEAGEAFIAALPEHEFDIPRQLVADAVVTSVEHDVIAPAMLTVEVELLLLKDG